MSLLAEKKRSILYKSMKLVDVGIIEERRNAKCETRRVRDSILVYWFGSWKFQKHVDEEVIILCQHTKWSSRGFLENGRQTNRRTDRQLAQGPREEEGEEEGYPKRARFRAITGVPAAATPTLSPIIRVRLRLGFRACSKGTEPRAEIATD